MRGNKDVQMGTTSKVMFQEPSPTLAGALGAGWYVGSAIATGAMLVMMAAMAAVKGLDQGELLFLTYTLAFLAGGILQQVWFNWEATMRLAYSGRMVGFGLSYFALLLALAWLGNWVPKDQPGAWIAFVVTYLLILGGLSVLIESSLRRQGIEYKEKLDEYRARKQ